MIACRFENLQKEKVGFLGNAGDGFKTFNGKNGKGQGYYCEQNGMEFYCMGDWEIRVGYEPHIVCIDGVPAYDDGGDITRNMEISIRKDGNIYAGDALIANIEECESLDVLDEWIIEKAEEHLWEA